MKAVTLTENADGTWTATIYSTRFVGTRDQCIQWLATHGESQP